MTYVSLTWVKASINDDLKKTRNALQQFFEDQKDESLQQCLVYLSEIEGAFKITQLQAAATLVEIMKQTIKSFDAQKSTYEALIKALIQLSTYLDYLCINKHDKPLALLPLINDLRACNSQPALAANSFFYPNLSVIIPEPEKVVNLSDEYLQKLRVAYKKGLAAVVKNSQQTGLEFIATVMQRLQAINSPMNKLWWVTEGIVEALLENGLKLNKTIFNLLKQLDAVITSVNEPPKKLLTHLLYFVAHAASEGNKITAIKSAFQLNDYVEQPDDNFLTVPSLEVIQTAVAEIDIEADSNQIENILSLLKVSPDYISKSQFVIEILAKQGIYADWNNNPQLKSAANNEIVEVQKSWNQILEQLDANDDENIADQIQAVINTLTKLSHNRVAELLTICKEHIKEEKQEILFALAAMKVYLDILLGKSDKKPEEIISLIGDQLYAIT
ncbi:hypothetical protein [Candidatus Marithrix sp. Canyon 246]|uniref:hypothetical protein n=1 Tax=Candidatus Marithrix sp. Canyon 246 TaxID=1827136 RepID=UPI00084A1CE8|nr:hypothetical protein [Candidatus Marithrix sp. Canyon 246]